MAYGEKYYLDFADLKGVSWRIGILKKDYAGGLIKLKATGDPVEMKWRGGDLYKPIRSSECIVNFMSLTNFQFAEFFTAGELDYLIQIKKNGSLWWEGVNIVENYSEPYIDTPYPIKLRFSDGLGTLKYQDYTNGLLQDSTHKTLLFTIHNCLSFLPFEFDKNIIEIVNIIENQVTENSGNWFLNKTYINESMFRTFDRKRQVDVAWSCYEILEEIMLSLGCTLFGSNNEWYVVRIEELEKATPAYVRWATPVHILNSGTIDIQKDITHTEPGITMLGQDMEMHLSEVFNQIEYIYKFVTEERLVMNFIRDFDMSLGSNLGVDNFDEFPFWEISPDLITLENAGDAGLIKDEDLSTLILPPPHWMMFFSYFSGSALQQMPVLDTGLWLKPIWTEGDNVTKRNITVTTLDKSELKVQAVLTLSITPGPATNLIMNLIYELDIYFSISIGTYFISEDGNGVLSWVVDSSKRIKMTKSVRIGDYDFSWSNSGTDLFVIFDFALDPFRLKLPLFPETGEHDLNIKMYVPVNPVFSINSSTIRTENILIYNLSYIYLPSDKDTLSTFESVNMITNVRKNIKTVRVKFGDEPHESVAACWKILQVGPVFTKGTDWHYRGEVDLFDAHEIFILKPYSKFLGKYRRELRGTLYGDFEFFNTLFSKYNKVYMINALNYSLKSATKNVELLEVASIAYIGTFKPWLSLISNPDLTGENPTQITSKEESEKGRMQNADISHTGNVNLTQRAFQTIKINDEKGTNDNYNNYPV